MRRTAAIGVIALACLLAPTAAHAADNVYTQSSVARGSAGSAKAPAGITSLTQKLTANTTVAGNRAADPLIEINATVSGLQLNTGAFPSCTLKQIEASAKTGWNFSCPAGSLVARGTVVGELGSSNMTAPGTTCGARLSVYNGGHGALAYFFTIASPTACGGLQTGTALPYAGTLKQAGANVVSDAPLPADASTNAGNPSATGGSVGLFASLVRMDLVWKSTYRLKGKLQPLFYSTGCPGGKRASNVTFTSVASADPTAPSGTPQTLAAPTSVTVAAQSRC